MRVPLRRCRLFTVTAAQADLTRQEPIEVRVNLGNAEDARVFEPNGISFEVGKVTGACCTNPSKTRHFFTSPDLVDRVFTREVEVKDEEGKRPSGRSRVRSARSRSIRAEPPSGGSCRRPPWKARGSPATSRTRTARRTPRRAWSEASASSDWGHPLARQARPLHRR